MDSYCLQKIGTQDYESPKEGASIYVGEDQKNVLAGGDVTWILKDG